MVSSLAHKRDTLSPIAPLKPSKNISSVRPILEYCYTVWVPHQTGHYDQLSMAQRLFLQQLGVRSGITSYRCGCAGRCITSSPCHLTLCSSSRSSIVWWTIDYPELPHQVDFHVPVGTRFVQPITSS